MEDDDTDFTPCPNTSSNLDTLFGFNKKPLQGNLSLTYTAPKAPKRESSPKKQPEEKTAENIILKHVYSFKLENRVYVSQGLTCLLINGNHNTCIYDIIIIYKTNHKELCICRITKNFNITLSPNNYVSFYDNNKQNWSIMFQSPGDLEQFALKVAICKFYSSQEQRDVLVQDLTPLTNSRADLNSALEIIYSFKKLKPEGVTTIKDDVKEKINLNQCNFVPFRDGLIGSSENSRRAIIVPHSKCEMYSEKLDSKSDLLIIIRIEKVNKTLPKLENVILESESVDPCDSLVDSSAEESTIKAKGVSIKEALTSTKSQKANLISRMARMGQATLPLKQDLNIGLSDSEEENLAVTTKPRISRKGTSNNSHYSNSQVPQIQKTETQQVSVYQNDLTWQQSQLAKLGVVHQQLLPVSGSPISSPTTDPNFSVYMSESRVQAAELRMGISKVSEKLDSVMNSLQLLNKGVTENKISPGGLIDSNGILSSIQAVITENEGLKGKVEEQKEKIEQQNDRIFHLLELNHKYIEKNSTSHEKQSENEFKLKMEIESLLKNKTKLEIENQNSLERINSLQRDLTKAEEVKIELKIANETMKNELEEIKKNHRGSDELKKKELDAWEEKMGKAAEAVTKLKERLKEVISENENLKSVIKDQKNEIEAKIEETKDTKKKNEEFEKVVEGLKKQMSLEESKSESKIEDLAEVVTKLERENETLKLKIEGEKNNINEIASKIYSDIKRQFISSKDYSISEILEAIRKAFQEAAGVSFPQEEITGVNFEIGKPIKSDQEENLTEVSTPESKSLEKEADNKQEESKSNDDNEAKPEKKTETNERVENDRRYQSYDQSWRSTKPPPPPLFDDKDEDDDWLN